MVVEVSMSVTSIPSVRELTEQVLSARRQVAGRRVREHGVELIALVIEYCQRGAGKHAAARQFDRHRIDEAIVDDYFEMHMRAGGEAGGADKADDLALAHVAADIEAAGIGGHMAVRRLVAVVVADAHIFTVAALLADLFDVAVAGGKDRGAGRRGPIDAAVQLADMQQRMRAPAEARCDDAG